MPEQLLPEQLLVRQEQLQVLRLTGLALGPSLEEVERDEQLVVELVVTSSTYQQRTFQLKLSS